MERNQLLVKLGVAGALFFLAPAARAKDAPPTVEHGKAFVHEGFYFRGALGAAGMTSNEVVAGKDADATSLSGNGFAGELSLGGTPRPGVVVAGTFLGYSVASPTFSAGGRTSTLAQRETLGIVGLTLDWYPVPRGGFHLSGTVGGGLMRGLDGYGYVIPRTARYGSAFSFGLGYDWWIARDVSLGVLARLTGAQLGGDVTALDGRAVSADTRVGTAGLLVSLLYQ